MKRNLLIFGLTFLVSFQAHAQAEVTILRNSIEVGKNLINHGENKKNEVWMVDTENSTMVWRGESGVNARIKMSFKRISEFPEN